MKCPETKIIEEVLFRSLFGSNPKLAQAYGTSEVTIGFQRAGKGRELVDFMSYDARADEFRCYEIKVTMADFRSKAQKSWYGNYNYLVITDTLYGKLSLNDWKKELPEGTGIIVVKPDIMEKKTVLRPKFQPISMEIKEMLKTSLIRTLFYKSTRRIETE